MEYAILSACSTPDILTPDDSSSTATTDLSMDSSDFEETSKKLMSQSQKSPRELKLDGSPVLLEKSDLKSAPLYLFHDGSGLCDMYSQMEGTGRDTYGFSPPGFFQTENQSSTLIEMAALYS